MNLKLHMLVLRVITIKFDLFVVPLPLFIPNERMFKKLQKWVEEAKRKHLESLDLSRFDHPLVTKTEWFPLKNGLTLAV